MTRTIEDRDQLCDEVEHGDLIPLTWDDTYGLMCTLQQVVGDFTPDEEDPLKFRRDLWSLHQQARQLARLAVELYAVAPQTEEEVEAERERVMHPRPTPAPAVQEETEDDDAAPAPRLPAHDLVSAFWALSQALQAEGKHPEVIAKDAVAHLEASRAAAT